MKIKIDMHVHTEFSPDCRTSLDDLILAMDERGIDRVVVLDHNTIEGALRLRERIGDRAVIGEEVRTTEGEITGIFLKERIPPDLTPERTIEAIRRQGGITYITHPFDIFRREVIRREALMRIFSMVDAIEGFNARSLGNRSNKRARRFAEEHDIPVGAGSDAHMVFEIGRGYVLMEPFSTPQEFLSNLRDAEIGGKRSSFFFTVATKLYKIMKGL